jgi:hypothetical protein
LVNQGKVTVTKDGNNITVKGDLDELEEFASSVASQGTHKWFALDIDTGLDTIVGATWDGSELTQADADEAASIGLGAGHIVFWGKADVLVSEPRTITIGAAGHDDIVINVTFIDE